MVLPFAPPPTTGLNLEMASTARNSVVSIKMQEEKRKEEEK
jgi:hypothetical protein